MSRCGQINVETFLLRAVRIFSFAAAAPRNCSAAGRRHAGVLARSAVQKGWVESLVAVLVPLADDSDAGAEQKGGENPVHRLMRVKLESRSERVK